MVDPFRSFVEGLALIDRCNLQKEETLSYFVNLARMVVAANPPLPNQPSDQALLHTIREEIALALKTERCRRDDLWYDPAEAKERYGL